MDNLVVRGLFVVAFGLGILLGGGSVLLYEQLKAITHNNNNSQTDKGNEPNKFEGKGREKRNVRRKVDNKSVPSVETECKDREKRNVHREDSNKSLPRVETECKDREKRNVHREDSNKSLPRVETECKDRKKRNVRREDSNKSLPRVETKCETCGKRIVRREHINKNSPDVETGSIRSADDDDEYFDCTDENDTIESSACQETATETGRDAKLVKLFDEVDQLLRCTVDASKKAYHLLFKCLDDYRDNVDVLWRLAKACHIMSTEYNGEDNKEKRKELIFEGIDFAEEALRLDDSNAEAHKWFAVAVGLSTEFLGVGEQIKSGFVFKKHVETAIELQPNDPYLHYLLGRFTYEVANVSLWKRSMASTFLAEVPTGTINEALEHCEKALSLSSVRQKEACLLMAKCSISQSMYVEGVLWLDHAVNAPLMVPDNGSAAKEVQSLLAEYESYR